MPLSTSGADASPVRLDAIDLLRGLAIAAVVVHHISWRMLLRGTLEAPGGPLFAAVYLGSEFGVPMFVAVSAFALVWRPTAWRRSLARRARRLLPAYALWSVVSLAARDLSLLAPREVGRALLFGTADVQFYYVPMLFELLLLWPLLGLVLVRRTLAGALLVLAAAAGFAELTWRSMLQPYWTPLVYYAVPLATGAALAFVLLPSRRPPALAGSRARLAVSIGLLVVAAVAAAAAVSGFLAQLPVAGAATTASLFWRALGVGRELAVTSCALTFAVALVAERLAASPAGRLLAALGRASYGVYLLHLLVASTVVYRVVHLDALQVAAAPVAAVGLAVTWAATLGLSWLVSDRLARHRASSWTVGGGTGAG